MAFAVIDALSIGFLLTGFGAIKSASSSHILRERGLADSALIVVNSKQSLFYFLKKEMSVCGMFRRELLKG